MYIRQKRKYKIINKLRFFTTFSIFILIVFSLVLGFKVSAKNDMDSYLIPVYVEPRDTLWSISEKFCPNDMDIRDYISIIKELNHNESSIIKPGQVLYMIVYNI